MAQTTLFSSQTGSGDDLILLHGWGLNSEVWQPVIPLLSQVFRIHAIDLPGFGDSPWSAEMCEIEAVSGRVGEYITEACNGPAHVLGWSMGGLVATSLALTQSNLVRHLITVASSPRFVAAKDWPGIAPDVLNDFQEQLSGDMETTLKRFLAVQTLGSPQARIDMKIMRQQLLSKPLPDFDALECGLRWLQNCDFTAQLEDLKMPLTRLYGRRDTLVPVAVAKELGVGEEHVFAQSAHAPFMTESEIFATWLQARLLQSEEE